MAQVFSDPPINFMTGVVSGGVARLGLDMVIPMTGHLNGVADGEYFFGVRPNHLFLQQDGNDTVAIGVKVELAEINGSETFIHVNHGEARLVVQEDGIHPRRIGSEITVYVNPRCFFVFEKSGRLLVSPFQT